MDNTASQIVNQESINSTPQDIAVAPSAYAVDICRVSKGFVRRTIGKGGYTTLKSMFLTLFSWGGAGETKRSTVLKDLTLRVPPGKSVGLIGKNGSGKSTLLKLITGIYKPDSGRVSISGRVAALIELGAGFHPDFTGRENLYLGGVMHGLSRRDIAVRFDTIVSFAELEDVIDEPVRTYSSGMFMRLGFSLAVHTDPDVLLIDEVLAVGDARFEAKCKDKLAHLRRDGKTLILVTHDLGAVERWCDEVLWLDQGSIKAQGDPRRVIDAYRQHVEQQEESALVEQDAEFTALDEHKVRWGSRDIEIVHVELLDGQGGARRVFHTDDGAIIELHYRVHQNRPDVVFGIGIERADGVMVTGTNTRLEKITLPPLGSAGKVRFLIKRLSLLEGQFVIAAAVHASDGFPYDYHKTAITFAVRNTDGQPGIIMPEHSWEVICDSGERP
jgi:lipopolysaccharide transport system ATP-binding protein